MTCRDEAQATAEGAHRSVREKKAKNPLSDFSGDP